ncbi:hypothetical protein KIN20_018085 [Parelaphostrongylus tenuis]|uniref:Uncharacterized protein n=1 Tax=Parelaphostrongylus tenuis TaxID=148309 RepID=A0AAD5N0P1_PARTN|nr:hypothetical protein KIN20_018085 [Parelaphostrongylus tenuis]
MDKGGYPRFTEVIEPRNTVSGGNRSRVPSYPRTSALPLHQQSAFGPPFIFQHLYVTCQPPAFNRSAPLSPTGQKASLFQPLLMQELNNQESFCNISELPSYTNAASPMFDKFENSDSEDSLDYCSDKSRAMLPDRKESLVEEIKRLPPAEQVVRNAPSCTPVANATQGCTLGTVSLNGSNNNTSHASMQQTNRERRLQYTQSEIEELHNYPSVTFTKREIPSDGGNVAPKGVGEGSKPSRITEVMGRVIIGII